MFITAKRRDQAGEKFHRIRPLLTIIIPTRDEFDNIKPLLDRIEEATLKITTELIFVDDSDDKTPEAVHEHGHKSPLDVSLIHRPPHRRGNGLAGAVVEGLHASRAPWVCVLDGDLQHPPECIPQLLAQAQENHADIAIASRFIRQARAKGLNALRMVVSRSAALAASLLFPTRLEGVTDPMSGFFLVRKGAVALEALRPEGFKILLEILVRSGDLHITEVSYRFEKRQAGDSKASLREGLKYLSHLMCLRFGNSLSHFTRFAAVGASGVIVNSFLLFFATEVLEIHYLASAVLATQGSTLWNFSLTEQWVFPGRRQGQPGWRRFAKFLLMNNLLYVLRGPILFSFTSVLGLHYLLSNLLSIGILTIMRFTLSSIWIWRKDRLERKEESSVSESESVRTNDPVSQKKERDYVA